MHNSDRVLAEKILYPSCFVIAVLKPDNFWWRASHVGKIEKIGVGSYDDETVGSGVLPNGLVGGEPGEAGIEDMH